MACPNQVAFCATLDVYDTLHSCSCLYWSLIVLNQLEIGAIWHQFGLATTVWDLTFSPSLKFHYSSTNDPNGPCRTWIDACLNKDSSNVLRFVRTGRTEEIQPFLCTPLLATHALKCMDPKDFAIMPHILLKLGIYPHQTKALDSRTCNMMSLHKRLQVLWHWCATPTRCACWLKERHVIYNLAKPRIWHGQLNCCHSWHVKSKLHFYLLVCHLHVVCSTFMWVRGSLSQLPFLLTLIYETYCVQSLWEHNAHHMHMFLQQKLVSMFGLHDLYMCMQVTNIMTSVPWFCKVVWTCVWLTRKDNILCMSGKCARTWHGEPE